MDVAIGIDLGGTKIASAVVAADGTVREHDLQPTDASSEQAVLDGVVAAAQEMLRRAPDACGVGVGIPGTIDIRRGWVVQTSNLPLHAAPVVEPLRERLGLPVAVDNDANVATLAEHRHGAARGAEHSVMLTLGTGVGGGVVIANRLLRGSTGAGAELGHMVIEQDGPPCPGSCPNNGCLEAFASGRALERMAREAGLEDPHGPSIVRRALAGDEDARAVVERVGHSLGVALSSVANIFDPDVIVLGGGFFAGAADILLPLAADGLRRCALRPQNEHARVVAALLGPRAGVVGAGALALDECR